MLELGILVLPHLEFDLCTQRRMFKVRLCMGKNALNPLLKGLPLLTKSVLYSLVITKFDDCF